LIKNRYASFTRGKGAKFTKGNLSVEDLSNIAIKKGEPEMRSGKQEMFENIINQYI
jgi:xylose isomerase